MGKAPPKGGGKQAQGGPSVPDAQQPPLPSMHALPAPPPIVTVTPSQLAAPAATDPSGSTDDSKLLEALMVHFKDKDNLPTHLKEQLEARAAQSHKLESKLLHGLVNQRDKARGALTKVRRDRSAFLAAWESYSNQLLALLQKQFSQRQATLTAFSEIEESCKLALAESSQALEKATGNSAATTDLLPQQEEMEAEEEDDTRAANVSLNPFVGFQHQAVEQLMSTLQADGSRTPRRSRGKDEVAVSSSPELKAAAPPTINKPGH